MQPPYSRANRVRGLCYRPSPAPRKPNIRQRITSADSPLAKGTSDAAGAPRPPVRGLAPHQRRPSKVPSGSTQPKTALASCFAMTLSAYNGTPAQPQTQAMGAARRDPRRGEIPGGRRQPPVRFAAHGSGSSVE